MGFGSVTTGASRGGFGSVGKKTSSSNTDELASIGRDVGLEEEVDRILDTTPKLSFIQRLGKAVGALNPAEAILTAKEEGLGRGLLEYPKNIIQGIGSAITGTDYEGERRTFANVVEKLGVENSIAKYGLGIVGDIFLDPSTYFGGAIAKGLGKATSIAAGGTVKAIGKVAPETAAGLQAAGQGLKDAAGGLFVFGYGVREGVKNKVITALSKRNAAREGIVLSNISRLGTGTLSENQQIQIINGLLSGKRAQFYARESGLPEELARKAGAEGLIANLANKSPEVQRTAIQQAMRSERIARQAGIEDPFVSYFPGLKSDSLKKFFEGTRGLRVGSEPYKKQFKDLLKDAEMVRNPAEAFAKTEVKIADNSIVRSELNSIVSKFGKPLTGFKTREEALRAGYELITEKGIAPGFGPVGKELGYLPAKEARFVQGILNPEFTTIDAIAKATGFDALTALFKRSVTGLFAPFHVRNYVSGMVQNFEVLGKDALNPKNIMIGHKIARLAAKGTKDFKGTAILGGKEVPLNKILKPFFSRFGGSSQYITDIADATKGNGITTLTSKNPLSANSIIFKKTRAIGNFIETQQKATAYVTALNQGKSIDEALKLAERAGFDYRAVTPFESQIMRRVIPFYTFTRKNVELQLRTLGESPERVNQIIKVLGGISGAVGGGLTQEEKNNLPDYLKEQIAIQTGRTATGLPEIASGFATPIEQPGSVFDRGFIRRVLASSNPLIKYSLEESFNFDFFRNRKLSDVVEADQYANMPGFIKDFLKLREVEKKDKNGKKRTAYTADPHRIHILNTLPTSRATNYLGQIFRDDVTPTSKAINAVTGLKPRPIDVETVKYFKDRDRKRELEDLLIRAGVIKRFEQTYKPK